MKTASIFLLTALLTFSVSAAVNITHKQTKKAKREYNQYRILNAAPVKYEVHYVINERNGKKTVGDPTSNSTGIGLGNGWYASGSIRLFVDGKCIKVPAKITTEGDTMTFSWDKAVLKMVFPEGSDKIYCQVKTSNAKRLQIGFLGMPGFVYKRKSAMKPYVSTSKANHLLADGQYKVRGGESWFMFYDGEINRRGIPVVILDPADVKSGHVNGSAKSPLISASFDMKKTECRFILMGIPSTHLDAETLYEDLKANSSKYVNTLKKFRF